MKILIAASELSPYAQTGSLGDSVAGLSENMVKAGHEVAVVLPFFRCLRENKSLGAKRSRLRFQIPVGSANIGCEIWEAIGPSGMKLLFIERDEFFDRSGLYGVDGRDYQDNAARFIFFSKCVTELARLRLPSAVHLFGWQAAMASVFIREAKLAVPTILSPFSLEYQGNFWSHDFSLTNLPPSYFSSDGLEFYGSMNFMKAGIVFSDAVVLPGGRFVAEAQTSLHGCGLENVLKVHSQKLEGIAPGIDSASESSGSKDGRKASGLPKEIFRDSLGDSRFFVVDADSCGGEGIGCLLDSLDLVPSHRLKVVLFGNPDPSIREKLVIALRRHAGRFVHLNGDREMLGSALECADFFLLPAPVEPTTSNLKRAMKKGVVPLLLNCAGLHEVVRDFDPVHPGGNGLVYYRSTKSALADAIKRALFLSDAELNMLSCRTRDTDFSWTSAIGRFEALQKRIIERTARMAA